MLYQLIYAIRGVLKVDIGETLSLRSSKLSATSPFRGG